MTYPQVDWIAPGGGDRPSFSADGTNVVYQNCGRLYIIPAEGGEPWLLFAGTDDCMPSRADWSWSPNTIAFGGAYKDNPSLSTIWLIESDGSNRRRLHNTGGLEHSIYPSWYESGQWIVAMDTSNPKYCALWRFTVDGSHAPVQLTTTDNFCAGRPSVAPGGEDAPVAMAGTLGPFNQQCNQIWIVQPPSIQPTQLNPEQGRSPNWSPDGKWILYESNRLTGGNYQLFVAPAPGSGITDVEPVPLTDPSYMAQHAEWSRQQDRIILEKGNGLALGVIQVPPQFLPAG
jgi:Tol biopolymer transport system component